MFEYGKANSADIDSLKLNEIFKRYHTFHVPFRDMGPRIAIDREREAA